MNYIRHLNAFFSFVKKDSKLTSSHVSLYMALFQYWNFNRFQNPFPIYRDNIMKLSKVGSKNTYHKCIKELHEAKYIYYQPSLSRFLPVRISLIRLDVQEEQTTRYKQLDLFGEESSNSACPKIETDSVPNLTATGTDFDTGTVLNVGHNIKHKHFNKTESKQPAKKIFEKNEKLSDAINNLAGVPNPGHTEQERSFIIPTLDEVESFFKSTNYPDTEAKKFFNHYKAIGWKIKGITPIEDWEAAAHKWMLNSGKYEPVKPNKEESPTKDIQYLFERFLEGQQVFKFILPEHFTQLNLELSEETMQQARTERINQLTGTNQHSLNQIWDAYLQGNGNNDLVIKDKPNLLDLAKRIAVLKHFQTQKLSP
jgi:hypothetical protein